MSRFPKDYGEANIAGLAGSMGTMETKGIEGNQIDKLVQENSKLRDEIRERDAELLNLYRRLNATDRPTPGY